MPEAKTRFVALDPHLWLTPEPVDHSPAGSKMQPLKGFYGNNILVLEEKGMDCEMVVMCNDGLGTILVRVVKY